MGQVGDLYLIPREKRAFWATELEQLGFTVEDWSERLSEDEKHTFIFLGKLRNGKKNVGSTSGPGDRISSWS